MFNALNISQDATDFAVKMDMRDYHSKGMNLTLLPKRHKKADVTATPSQWTALQKISGTLNFLGHAVLLPRVSQKFPSTTIE